MRIKGESEILKYKISTTRVTQFMKHSLLSTPRQMPSIKQQINQEFNKTL